MLFRIFPGRLSMNDKRGDFKGSMQHFTGLSSYVKCCIDPLKSPNSFPWRSNAVSTESILS